MKKDSHLVVVIGAGASNEANLPTGNDLKINISQLLDFHFEWGRELKSGDHVIASALQHHVKLPSGQNGDINPYIQEALHVKNALPLALSIDNFLDAHRDNKKMDLCGKLAIVRSILEAEKNSLLYFEKTRSDSTINFDALKATWFTPFFQLLTENCSIDEVSERFKQVTLIIFNYDRCVEHFIYYALQNYYNISDKEAVEIFQNINIYHPYGVVGALPWINHSESMEFGAEPSSVQLLELVKKIKTFTEGTDPDSSDILAIAEHMSLANKLVYIGFAFHKLNMKLIIPTKLKGGRASKIKCFATTYQMSESDKETIEEQIKELYDGAVNVKMANLKSYDFFAEFWRSLSF